MAAKIDCLLQQIGPLGFPPLHLISGMPPRVRLAGELKPLEGFSIFDEMTCRGYLLEICPKKPLELFMAGEEIDFVYEHGLGLFRVSYFLHRDGLGGVFRWLSGVIPQVDTTVLQSLLGEKKGLVLLGSPPGGGKTTTMASLIDALNRQGSRTVVLLENDLDYLHRSQKSLISQREIGEESVSWLNAVETALRESPDILVLGQVANAEIANLAIRGAFQGIAIYALVEAESATAALENFLGLFKGSERATARKRLARALSGAIVQLFVSQGKDRAPALAQEILLASETLSRLIEMGQFEQILPYLRSGNPEGMQSMEDALLRLNTIEVQR